MDVVRHPGLMWREARYELRAKIPVDHGMVPGAEPEQALLTVHCYCHGLHRILDRRRLSTLPSH